MKKTRVSLILSLVPDDKFTDNQNLPSTLTSAPMISTPLSVADPTLQLLQQQQMLQNGMNDPLSVNQMALAQQMASLQMQQQLLQQQFSYPVKSKFETNNSIFDLECTRSSGRSSSRPSSGKHESSSDASPTRLS